MAALDLDAQKPPSSTVFYRDAPVPVSALKSGDSEEGYDQTVSMWYCNITHYVLIGCFVVLSGVLWRENAPTHLPCCRRHGRAEEATLHVEQGGAAGQVQ